MQNRPSLSHCSDCLCLSCRACPLSCWSFHRLGLLWLRRESTFLHPASFFHNLPPRLSGVRRFADLRTAAHTCSSLFASASAHISSFFTLYTTTYYSRSGSTDIDGCSALLCPYLHRHPYTPFTAPAPPPVSYHTHLQPTPLPQYCLMHLHAIRLLNLPQRTPTPVR